MDITRCPRCNKLLRADTQSCPRCGTILTINQRSRRRVDDTLMPSRPTSPPASPHRAGHYSGLHPEDQPFQSSFFLRVRRPPEMIPVEADANVVPDMPRWYADDAAPEQSTRTNRALADFPTLHPRRTRNTPLPATPVPPRATRKKTRAVPFLLTAALILFLVASSLLTLLLLKSNQSHSAQPRLLALPGELRVGDVLQLSGSNFASHTQLVLTRDAHIPILDAQSQPLRPTTDAQGTFQLHLPITVDWSIGTHAIQASAGGITVSTSLTIQAALVGPPRLQLGSTHLDLGAGNPGAISHETMTLTNAGGGQVEWSAQSSVPWLSLSPSSGSFAGSALITLTVDRSHLAPQAYTGQVIFTQQGVATQLLSLSMTVNTSPANLWISTASLAFSSTPVQSPAGQSIVIQNSGGQALNWTSGTSTTDGASWLSITPPGGLLPAHTSAILTVSVNTRNLPLGSYQGTLNFSYAGGPSQEVAITLAVNAPPLPVMHLSSQSLSFKTNQGFNPAPQSFTISNTGNAPLNWLIQPDANGASYLSIAPVKGSVPPGQSANVSIAPLLGNANGTINSTLTLLDSDPGTTVPAQQVAISIAITNEPILVVDKGSLEFDYPSTPTETTTQLLIFTNTGSLPLNWALTGGAPWLSVDVSSGTVTPANFGFINVTATNNGLKPGTYTATLTLKDTNAGTVVAPQHLTITLIVSG